MHVFSKPAFIKAMRKHPNDAVAILDTYKVLRGGIFNTPDALKAVFGSMDNFKYKAGWYVIDIGGNNLRLLAFIQFEYQRLYVKYLVTHAEYDKLTMRAKKGEI